MTSTLDESPWVAGQLRPTEPSTHLLRQHGNHKIPIGSMLTPELAAQVVAEHRHAVATRLGYASAEVDDLRQRLKATSDECNDKANALHRVRALADRAAGYGFVLAPEQVYEALDGEDEAQAGVPDRPRTWALPDEPGPEVTAVRDHNGDVWRREEDRDGHLWQRRWPSGTPRAPFGCGWPYLVRHYGPLTDATPADDPDAP